MTAAAATAHRVDPPGPATPAGLQMLQWSQDFDGFFARNARRYGLPFSLRLPVNRRTYCFASARAVQSLFRGSPAQMHAGAAYEVLRQSAGDRSLLLLDEDEHLRMRRLLLPPLHGDRLLSWRAFVETRARQETDTWSAGDTVELRPVMERITLDVITRIVFGIRDAARADELRALLPTLFDLPLPVAVGYVYRAARLDLGPRSPWGRYRRRRARIDTLLFAEIDQRRRDLDALSDHGRAAGTATTGDVSEPTDVLTLLLRATDTEGCPLSDRELRDQLVTLLVAGHETTATSLAWAFERLVRTPAALSCLEEDIASGGTAYLDAVIRETMRARPVVAQIARTVQRDMIIDGWSVPAGTMVMIPISLMHRDPVAFPEPEAFRPERFLGADRPGPTVFLPFGGGVRRCIGAGLALMEMREVISTIVRSVRLAPDQPAPERPRVRGITQVPERGGRVRVVERRLSVGTHP